MSYTVITVVCMIITCAAGNIDFAADCLLGCHCAGAEVICKEPASVENIIDFLSRTDFTQLTFRHSRINNLNLTMFLEVAHKMIKFQFEECHIKSLEIEQKTVFPALVELSLAGNELQELSFQSLGMALPNLRGLNLSFNRLRGSLGSLSVFKALEWLNLSGNKLLDLAVTEWPASLLEVYASSNQLHVFNGGSLESRVGILDLSQNYLQSIDCDNISVSFPELQVFNLSRNILSVFDNRLSIASLQKLDISHNKLIKFGGNSSFTFWNNMPQLEWLSVSGNPLLTLDVCFDGVQHVGLRQLFADYLELESISFAAFSGFLNLQVVSIAHNKRMVAVFGSVADHLRAIKHLNLAENALKTLPPEFFEGKIELQSSFNLSGNPWACDCRLVWFNLTSDLLKSSIDLNQTSCYEPLVYKDQPISIAVKSFFEGRNASDCEVGIALASNIQYGLYGKTAILECPAFGTPTPSVRWDRVLPGPIILSSLEDEGLTRGSFRMLPDGSLLVSEPTRGELGSFRCTVWNTHGNASAALSFRFYYYRLWTVMKIYSVLCGFATAIVFFILHCIYVGIRKVVLWRISQMERTSRARMILESIEKYKQRQIENLYDKYTKRVQQIRENYNAQAEHVRMSYASQMDRFRDYRIAQMDAMSQHIDTVRDSYGGQVQRIREYGSRQLDRLWESYQSQLNRVRVFSLQQRLRIMRQYKIKQIYLDKLMKSLNIDQCRMPERTNSDIFAQEMMELPPLDLSDRFLEDDGISDVFNRKVAKREIAGDSDSVSLSEDYHSLPGDILRPEWGTSNMTRVDFPEFEPMPPLVFDDFILDPGEVPGTSGQQPRPLRNPVELAPLAPAESEGLLSGTPSPVMDHKV